MNSRAVSPGRRRAGGTHDCTRSGYPRWNMPTEMTYSSRNLRIPLGATTEAHHRTQCFRVVVPHRQVQVVAFDVDMVIVGTGGACPRPWLTYWSGHHVGGTILHGAIANWEVCDVAVIVIVTIVDGKDFHPDVFVEFPCLLRLNPVHKVPRTVRSARTTLRHGSTPATQASTAGGALTRTGRCEPRRHPNHPRAWGWCAVQSELGDGIS